LAEVSVAADASSVRLKYSGAGAVTAVSADPSIATATYDAATGRITVQALKAGSTTVQVNVGADSVYAASEPLAFTINVVESEFLGGSLRMDVPASSGLTSLRMGYRLTMSATAFDAGAVGWRWAYGTAADNLTQASDAIKYTVESRDEAAGTVTIVSNIVFTDIPQRYYDVTLYSQLQIFTKSNNGEGKAASAGVYGRSVSQVAGMIALDTSASIDEIAYAQALLEA
jgi:phage baseplate assembly protein gpV